jgi:mitochondrial import receptor subunit TOM22
MVRLTEVPDEHFQEKRGTTKDDVLLTTDDEDDYTDTGKAIYLLLLSSLFIFA